MKEDNWENRGKGMVCRTCIFFVEKKKHSEQSPELESVNKIGRCRRHAPTMSGFPVMFDSDWCGDHKLNENKT